MLGVLLGGVRNETVWDPSEETTRVDGFTLGAWADAPLPVSGLAIVVEGSYARRGGDVVVDQGGQPGVGGVRASYLHVGAQVQLSSWVGPARLHVAAGPAVDQLLSSSLDPVLAQALDHESPVAFAVTVGAGLAVEVGRVMVGADARLVEGLGDAYAGSFTRFHHRSWEVRLRMGVPLDRLRGR